jgi:hypothetical protein
MVILMWTLTNIKLNTLMDLHYLETLLAQVFVDSLVKKAYDNWMFVIEYDGKALVGPRSNKKGNSSRSEASMLTMPYSAAYSQQAPLTREPVAMHPEQAAGNAGLTVGGKSVAFTILIMRYSFYVILRFNF